MSWRGPRVVRVLDAHDRLVDLDLHATMRHCLRLPAVREVADSARMPDVVVRRRWTDKHAGGHAKVWCREIVLSVGQASPLEQVEELILHEVLHVVLPDGVHHGPAFRSALIRSAREMWPCDQVRAVQNAGRTYAIDRKLWTAARDWRLDRSPVAQLSAG